MIDTTGSLLSRQVRRKIERQKNKNATLTVKPEYLKDLCALKYYEASDTAEKQKRALERKQKKRQAFCRKTCKPRLCAECGHLFRPNTASQKYCSADCRRRHYQSQRGEQ